MVQYMALYGSIYGAIWHNANVCVIEPCYNSGHTQYSWVCRVCCIIGAIWLYNASIHCWCYLPSSRLHPRRQLRHLRPLCRQIRHEAGRYGRSKCTQARHSRHTTCIHLFKGYSVYMAIIDNYRELEVESPSSPVTKPRSQAPVTQTGPCVEGSDREDASQEPTPLRSK